MSESKCIYCRGYIGTIMCRRCLGTGNEPTSESKNVWYFVSTPPRIGKLEDDEMASGPVFATFEDARDAMIRDMQRDICIYQSWIKRRQEQIRDWVAMTEEKNNGRK